MTDFKHDVEKHEDARRCVLATYDAEKFTVPSSCKFLFEYTNPKSGYYGRVYRRGNDIIIASRGTYWDGEWSDFKKTLQFDSFQDLNSNDKDLFLKYIPKQAADVMFLYNQCKGHGNIILAGDSLGGSTSAITGVKTGADTVVFNPYGIKDILENYNLKYSNTKNIINYCNKKDFITGYNADNHIGTIYEMKTKEDGIGLYYHFLENQQPITEQKEISRNDLPRGKTFKKGVDFVSDNWENLMEKVIEADVHVVKFDDNLHDFIDSHLKKFYNSSFGGYRSDNGGQVYVKEYRRSDGTIVRAHWRDWPGTFDPNKKLSHMEQDELNNALDFWMDDEKYA